MNDRTKLGDRMKEFENLNSKLKLNDDQPVCVRLDGKAFHTFTKGLKRPFDERFTECMVNTMNFLLETTNAKIGYTQSDEITLIYFNLKPFQQTYLSNRIQKLSSILASICTAKFNSEINIRLPEKKDTLAYFDCRVWNVPHLIEAANLLIWRQEDAIKNSISMAAHDNFSDKELMGVSSIERIKMLGEIGISWPSYPEYFKNGTFARKENIEIEIPEELKKYKANLDKQYFLRSTIKNFYPGRLSKIKNPAAVLFDPIFLTEDMSWVILD